MAGGLDHLVVVAHDLDRLGAFYERLGFTVGAENRHQWGTLNRIVQFDGCFLELLTTETGFERPADGEPVARFANVIDDYLAQREGLAGMVLEGFDPAEDHRAFAAAGVGVPESFYFRRQGRRPDGDPVEVAFSLEFARSDAISDACFFSCHQHAPEMFWNPAFQVHRNGVTGIRRVVFTAGEPRAVRSFFTGFTGVEGDMLERGGIVFRLPRSRLEVLPPALAGDVFGAAALPRALDRPRFAAIDFAVNNLAVVRGILREGDIAFDDGGAQLVVRADQAHGVTLAFSAG